MASSYNLLKEAAGIEIVCANKMKDISKQPSSIVNLADSFRYQDVDNRWI